MKKYFQFKLVLFFVLSLLITGAFYFNSSDSVRAACNEGTTRTGVVDSITASASGTTVSGIVTLAPMPATCSGGYYEEDGTVKLKLVDLNENPISGYEDSLEGLNGVFHDGDNSYSMSISGLPAGSYKMKAVPCNPITTCGAAKFSDPFTYTPPPATYTVTGTAGSGGTISPSSRTVNSGQTTTFTVTPNSGYTASASGCGGSLSGTTYTTGAITSNCTVTATFTAASVPPTPTNLTATPGACGTGTINVSWTASSGATGYILLDNGNTIYTGANTSYSHTGLSAGSSHAYNVAATNANGTSGNTSTVSAFAPSACSAPVVTLSAKIILSNGAEFSRAWQKMPVTFKNSTDKIRLTWNATNSPTSCTADGDWSGTKTSSGTEDIPPSTPKIYNFTLTCTGAGGSDSETVQVEAVPDTSMPNLVPDFASVNIPDTITIGVPVTLTAKVKNTGSSATSASPGWGNSNLGSYSRGSFISAFFMATPLSGGTQANGGQYLSDGDPAFKYNVPPNYPNEWWYNPGTSPYGYGIAGLPWGNTAYRLMTSPIAAGGTSETVSTTFTLPPENQPPFIDFSGTQAITFCADTDQLSAPIGDNPIGIFEIAKHYATDPIYPTSSHTEVDNCTPWKIVNVTGGVTTYSVTPSAGANGTISPNTPQTVNSGATAIFTVTPNAGYTASVEGTCGGFLAGTTYTTNPVLASCTVIANFTASPNPDLTVQYDPTTIKIPANTSHTFSATVQNIGSVTTGSAFNNMFQTATGFTLKQDGTPNYDLPINRQDYDVGTTASALAGGATLEITKSLSFSPGTYYVRACADLPPYDYGVVLNENEENNCNAGGALAWQAIEVGPDLTASAPVADNSGPYLAGDSISFSSTIANSGVGDVAGTVTHIFQYDYDINHENNNEGFIEVNTTNGIVEGDNKDVSAQIPTQSDTILLYIRVCADNDANWSDLVDESNEGNNCSVAINGGWTVLNITSSVSCGIAGDLCPIIGSECGQIGECQPDGICGGTLDPVTCPVNNCTKVPDTCSGGITPESLPDSTAKFIWKCGGYTCEVEKKQPIIIED